MSGFHGLLIFLVGIGLGYWFGTMRCRRWGL